NFKVIYEQWEHGVFAEELFCDIVIPLICVHFSFDSLRISNDTLIERMSEDFQLARCPSQGHGFYPQDVLLGAATHALVLEGWSTNNVESYNHLNKLYDIGIYAKPLEKVDAFFAALRVQTGIETGYGQIITRPTNWMLSWNAWLPRVYGARTRAY